MAAAAQNPQALRVLLVEDSPLQVRMIELATANLPLFELIHVANDGIDGLEYLRREGPHAGAERPDVVLCDINMPRMDGFELLEQVQSDDKLRQIPFVMLTTSENEDDVVQAYERGASTFITKPIDLTGLENVLRHFANYWEAAMGTAPSGASQLDEASDANESQICLNSIGVLALADGSTAAAMLSELLAQVPEFKLLAAFPDGSSALAFLRRVGQDADTPQPHLILLDLDVEGPDGLPLLNEIRADERLKTTVVVALAGPEKQSELANLDTSGANTFLTKPPSADGMRAVLRRFSAYWADHATKLPPV